MLRLSNQRRERLRKSPAIEDRSARFDSDRSNCSRCRICSSESRSMKAFWVRILLWFFLTFLGVSLCFFGTAYLIQSRTFSPASGRTEEHQGTGHDGTG